MLAITTDAPAPVYLLAVGAGAAVLFTQRPILEWVDSASRQLYLDRLPRPVYLSWLWFCRAFIVIWGVVAVLVGVAGFVAALDLRPSAAVASSMLSSAVSLARERWPAASGARPPATEPCRLGQASP
jgi:hypothetical protein